LLDIMMPKIDGLEVCRRLKTDPTVANSTIILLSGKNQNQDIEAGLATGADDYVTKPFSPLALIGKIAKVLEQPVRDSFSQTLSPPPTTAWTF
jgi:CheY-like chemotaxis protein